MEGGSSFDINRGPSNRCAQPPNRAALGRVVGGLVRLPFHDAVTYNPVTSIGGPDGCVDFNDPDNGGLSKVWTKTVSSSTSLQGYYNKWATKISQADFFALAGMVGVMMSEGPDIYGRKNALCSCVADLCVTATADISAPCMQFNYGRDDSTTCAATDTGLFPSSQLAHQHIIDVFITRLGFTAEEVVALMGGHTVGRAVLDESKTGFTKTEVAASQIPADGLPGAWDQSPDRFDNKYFQQIRNVTWVFNTHSTFENGTAFAAAPKKTFQWSDGPHASLMLNTDMALVWDVTITVPVTNGGATVDCLLGQGPPPPPNRLGGGGQTLAQRFSFCHKSTTFEQYVEEFANTVYGQKKFFARWASSYTKLLELGWRDAKKKGTLTVVGSAACN